MRRVFLALVFVALSSPAWAAYTTATVAPNGVKRFDDGTVDRVEVIFTGDAGEKPVTLSYKPQSLTSAEESIAARRWRDQQIAALNNRAGFAALPALQPGQVIPAAPAPPAPTALSAPAAWVVAAKRLGELIAARNAIQAAGAPAVVPAAMTTDINELAALVDDYANDFYLAF